MDRKNTWAITHDMSKTSEYNIWRSMRQRCQRKNHGSYKFYGGRGIKVCDRWQTFENFYKDMGAKPTSKHTIERVNNDGNYEPSNCKWATRKEQAQNRRPSKPLTTFNGKSQSLADWAKELGVRPGLIYERKAAGLPLDQVLAPRRTGWQRANLPN